jgi:hypothetical protein
VHTSLADSRLVRLQHGVLAGADARGWWQLVPIWEPDQTATPLRRWETSRPVLGDGDMSFTATDVGRRIALLRRRLGLSQVAFARKAGISRNALVDYCS